MWAVPANVPARRVNVIIPPEVATWVPGVAGSASAVVIVPRSFVIVIYSPSRTWFPPTSRIIPLVMVLVALPSALIVPGTGVRVIVPAGRP